MKKVLAIACLLVALTFVVATMVSAQAQPGWRLYITADDGANASGVSGTTVGVFSSSKDGYGVAGRADGLGSDNQDQRWAFTAPTNLKAVGFVFDNKLWSKHVQGPRVPLDSAYNVGEPAANGNTFGEFPYEPNRKIWDMRIFAYGTGDIAKPIRLKFSTVGSTVQPPLTLPNVGGFSGAASYYLRMVDNRGIEGAPANYNPELTLAQNVALGSAWVIPVPTGPVAANSMFFSLNLPTLNLSVKDEGHAITEGYVMQFYQTPEPSSLLALGTGLMGLAGFVSRRRRS